MGLGVWGGKANGMGLKTYRGLEVWQKAIALVEAVYRRTNEFPLPEKFGLTRQIQRAAISIPASIAEGHGRSHRGDYTHHLSVAKGSLMEVETHLTLAVRLKFAARAQVVPAWRLSQQVGRMLTRLIASLRTAETPDPKPPTADR